jgi:voltage-gated potassium channel Kch
MRRPNLVERRLSKFMQEQPTVRSAARAIVAASAAVMVGGGVLIWLVDRSEYPNPWIGMWWAIQTATTVGYGDVTPRHVSGRIVGVVVMLWGVAFISIITAIITTTFITRARVERGVGLARELDESDDARSLLERFDAVEQKLASLEAAIRDSTGR